MNRLIAAGLLWSALSGCVGVKFERGADAEGGAAPGGAATGGAAAGSAAAGGEGNAHGGAADAGVAASASGGAGARDGVGGAGAAAGTSGDAGDGGEGGAPPNECPCAAPTPTCVAGKCVARGPSMVKAARFYVDSTEVTVGQYAGFLAARGDDTSGQAKECAWNDSFEPLASDPEPRHPVTNVDFCDAAAFCAWADKQLCGKIDGGELLFHELADASKSQWFAACGGPKGQLYPYGSVFEAGACNDSSSAGKVSDVGAHESCGGYYANVFDLVGNVAEWVNACDARLGAVDGCETIGGSYAQGATCSDSSLKHRDEQLPTLGFRCCSP